MGSISLSIKLFLSFITIALCDDSAGQGSYQSRIAGGHVANIEDHPYHVHIFPSQCGGSILAPKWIVTAWKCYLPNMSVLAGHDNIEGIVSGKYKVRKSYHPTDIWQDDKNDPIMLLELFEDLKLDGKTVMTVPIYSLGRIKDGLIGTVSGFGATNEYDKKNSLLHAVEVPISTHATCVAKHPSYRKVLSTNADADFCAGYDRYGEKLGGHHSHCEGDYGSGMIVEGQLIGVAVHSIKCGKENTPAVYASVPFVRDWIIQTMNKIDKKNKKDKKIEEYGKDVEDKEEEEDEGDEEDKEDEAAYENVDDKVINIRIELV